MVENVLLGGWGRVTLSYIFTPCEIKSDEYCNMCAELECTVGALNCLDSASCAPQIRLALASSQL